MNVLHISPTFFSDQSVIGGGERYPQELARFMAAKVPTVFLSFGNRAEFVENQLRYVFSPSLFQPAVWKWLIWADVIHCHQVFSMTTDFAIFFAKLFKKKVYATDLGGGGRSLAYRFPILKLLDGLLLISEFSKLIWQKRSEVPLNKIRIIGGGVDLQKFLPGIKSKHPLIVYVGRILPHKGIENLIDAVSPGVKVEIIGRAYDLSYYELLKEKARGKEICFLHDTGDQELLEHYQRAWVVVQPSQSKTYSGGFTEVPELLGLVSLEAQSCGTPVIVSDAGSLPETVRDGETGFIVPQRDVLALRERLNYLLSDPQKVTKMGKQARGCMEKSFCWEKTVQACLQAYGL